MTIVDTRREAVVIRVIRREDFDETALSRLLMDAVESGASVGFLSPLSLEEARAYWVQVKASLGRERVLLGAFRNGVLVGSVQLAPAGKANAQHRAEVQKLLVLRRERGRGLGRALMAAVEALAREYERSLLVLDTQAGSAAEGLYERLGYRRAGEIPGYAASAGGGLHATVVFYKLLSVSD
ncbi:MAG: GNAT family N-acetyltransferase [Gammaproteobacteria bacterium]|nr:GNAT family N-acetyltransferase [Gammaproteobacteria bacterium]